MAKMRDSHGLGERLSIQDFTFELADWLNNASVFVSASLYEGNPNTVLEAAALKCPLVLSNIDQHREMLDETCVTFADPGPYALAKAIEYVLSNRDEARRKSEAAYRRVREFTVEKMVREYTKVYAEILN